MQCNKKVIQIVDDMIPLHLSNNVIYVTNKRKMGKPVIFQNGEHNVTITNTGIGEPIITNHGLQLRSLMGNKCFASLGEVLDASKQFSSTTIVNGADSEAEAGVTTLHFPVLGLEPATTTIDMMPGGSSLGLPLTVETLEVPVEINESDEVQTIHVSQGTPLAESSDIQPMVIASTDSQGNCFVALQDNPVLNPTNSWRSKEAIIKPKPTTSRTQTAARTSRSQVPTVTKVLNNRLNTGQHPILRCGRSRMIADQITSIPVADFKIQLNDTSDIIGALELAPTTKLMMHHLQSKGVGKYFASPGRKMFSKKLTNLFSRHLNTNILNTQETFSDMELLPLGYKPEVDRTKIKRITRRRRYPEAEEYQRRMLQEQMQQTLQNLLTHLDTSESFKEETQGNLQVLVEAAENGSYCENENNRVVDVYGNEEIGDNSIIVIHDGQESNQGAAYSQQNIEVLLAAAESGYNGENIHQVIICQPDSDHESILQGTSSIIIVPNDSLEEPETIIS